MRTLYDILGIVPAADQREVCLAYSRLVTQELDDGDIHGSMWWSPRLETIAKATEAMKTLVHGDRRKAYDKKLIAANLICPLCEGKGRNKFGMGLQSRVCIACGGSGKAVQYKEA